MKKYVVVAATLLFGIFIFSILSLWLQARYDADELMTEHISSIAQALNQIHQDCQIISFEHVHNYVDFLNVVSFYGSEVGSLNLAHPEKWNGPYLKDNPTIQEHYYQVVRTKNGYYVVPGQGVKLGNGLIVGKDIVFDENTDINQLIMEKKLVSKQGKLLAQLLSFR